MFPEVRLGPDPTFPRYKGTWAVTAPLVSTTVWDCTLSAGLGYLIDGLLRYSPVITRQLALPHTCLLQKKGFSFIFSSPKEAKGGMEGRAALGTARVGCWVLGWLRSWELSAGFGDRGSSPPGSGGALQPHRVPVVSRAHPGDGGISGLCSRRGWWAHLAPFTFCKPLDAWAQASYEPLL